MKAGCTIARWGSNTRQQSTKGSAEAEARYVMDIYDGTDWTEMDIEDLKVENRTTPKISRKLIFGLFCCCVAFHRHYGRP
jgi:hypothetical protein